MKKHTLKRSYNYKGRKIACVITLPHNRLGADPVGFTVEVPGLIGDEAENFYNMVKNDMLVERTQ